MILCSTKRCAMNSDIWDKNLESKAEEWEDVLLDAG